MSDPSLNLSPIINPMQAPIQRYAERIRELGGTNALTLVLFGSLAAGSFDPGRHTARSVLVLQSVDLDVLRQLAKDGAKLGKASIAAPLIMTPEYIEDSVDVFPLEFIEIQQRHLCVFGPDHFEGLSFDPTHVRLECERELKTLLISMRQALLSAAGHEKLFKTIDTDVADRLMRTLRGLLWLHEKKEGLSALQTIEEVEITTNTSLPGLRDSIQETGQHGWAEFQALYHEIDTLRKLVDAW